MLKRILSTICCVIMIISCEGFYAQANVFQDNCESAQTQPNVSYRGLGLERGSRYGISKEKLTLKSANGMGEIVYAVQNAEQISITLHSTKGTFATLNGNSYVFGNS